MDERLRQLQRLTSAMATRKRAYELRMAQVNSRISALAGEEANLMSAAGTGQEPYPGASHYYIKRLESLGRQLAAHKRDLRQLALLHLKASADLRRAEIISAREAGAVEQLRQSRYLEQVIDVTLAHRS